MRKALTVVFVLGVLLAVAQPAQAECGLARLIRSATPTAYSYVATPTVVPEIGVRSSVTTGAKGSFWILGNGDPTPHPAGDEQGVDNGSWDAVIQAPGPNYYYGGWLTFGISPGAYYPYSAVIAGTWAADGRIDGCPDPIANPCIAVLLTDQNNGIGYFALISKAEDNNDNFELTQGGNAPYNLAQIPKLAIDGSDTIDDSTVELLVTGPSLAELSGGLYLDGDCPSPIAGYKVRAQNVLEGGDPPEDRARGDWNDIAPTCCGDPCLPENCGTNSIPLGTSATVQVGCTGNSDVYLATSLLFDSGFELDLVGENSSRVACGPTLADPQDLQPRKPARKPGRKTKR